MSEDNEKQLAQLKKIIKEMVEQALLDEKKSKSKTKPGGGLTDAGAQRRINKSAFMSMVRNAINSQDGDVEDAAKSVGVATRTLYGYLEDEPKLQKVKDHVDDEAEKKEKSKKQAQEKSS